MLLPEAARGGVHEFLIAALPHPPYIAGAAAFLRLPDRFESVQVHVVPPLRRQGVGSRLLEAVKERAVAARAGSLTAWIDTLAAPGVTPFAERLGFRTGQAVFTAETEDAVATRGCFAAWVDRFHARGDRWRIIPMRDADRDRVASLWLQYIAASPGFPLSAAAAEIASPQFDDSPVLLKDGRVEGFLLARFDSEPCHIYAIVLTPEVRDGFAVAALMLPAVDHGLALGRKSVRFEWRSGVLFTEKTAQRVNAKLIRRLQQFTLDMDPEPFGR
jgi:N-acetylglutamate synthase-like GNAT family acetyltransferase